MKVIVLTRGGLRETLEKRSKPHRKVVVEPAEVSSAHSTKEVTNHHKGKEQTVGKD